MLAPEDSGVLAGAVPATIGVKAAHRGADGCAEFLRRAPGLALFAPWHELATGLANGARGAHSSVARLSPAGAVRRNRRMHTDPAGALEPESRIRQFMSECTILFWRGHGIANMSLDKLLAAIGARLPWPYSWMPEEKTLRLRPAAGHLLPELFEGENDRGPWRSRRLSSTP